MAYMAPDIHPLRRRRQTIGVSLERVARVAGCSLSTMRLADRGFTGVSDEMLARINAALDELEAEEVTASQTL
jgi:predicted transcriptional regulator